MVIIGLFGFLGASGGKAEETRSSAIEWEKDIKFFSAPNMSSNRVQLSVDVEQEDNPMSKASSTQVRISIIISK